MHACWHGYLIKKNRLIQSNQKIIEYTIGSLLTGVILVTGFGCKLLPLILFAVLTRMAFFAPMLNLLRGKSYFYRGESSRKKRWTFDWIEAKIGLPVWLLAFVYLAAYLVYLIIYL